ncbi:RagB/SusD family nutrient uptake outer membrane protein [Lutibacter sp. A80]|uniref:RagB/SusD family nutrient uptake outer membrane protein n=1 Tax=Lutibacter sp. A80 TaxID=2918453 RepID=UPI001F066C2B|nr:RagB/SusD family nutrient uptake outer membrane protein [Lutibacter sp. A80]UMB61705.1 RagB/SusD family nutrient uptake outer membrane protein [Lutibacter sp. A80]
MKYIIIKFAIALLTIFTIGSCSDDILNTEASDSFTEDAIYSDVNQAKLVVVTAYNTTDSWAINRSQWWTQRIGIEGASWEAKFNFKDLDTPYKMRGGWSPSNAGLAFNNRWATSWDYVKLINEFLEKIEGSEAMEEAPEEVAQLKAEMTFLRAFTYFNLVKYYGGVPIIKKSFGLDDEFNLSRDSFEDCVDFIVNDLDEAALILPMEASEFGRATKLSALAVKSRVLLYAASELHDPSTVPNGSIYDYTKSTKWQDAADAAKAVIDLVGDRDLIPVANATEYQNLFLHKNQDILFGRSYGSLYAEMANDINTLPDQAQSPNGYTGWGLSSPSHNFTLEFNMKDGSRTNNETFDALNINEGREMRYYANLLFQGADFRGRNVDYALADNPSDETPDGLDSPKGLGNQLHSSKTGYNIRKFQDESLSTLTTFSVDRPYIMYRLAEIYLNYAEAMYYIDENIARDYVNKVSNRALQPNIDVSGAALLEAIKRERRVELCFEGHNFFDERRWMNQDHIGGYDIRGLKWTKSIDGTLNYEEYTVVNRPWFDYRYYLPIPQTEIDKDASLEQNYGY